MIGALFGWVVVRYLEIWGYLVEKWWPRVFSLYLEPKFWKLLHRERWLKNILGKCLVTDLNIIRQRDFSISSYLSTLKWPFPPLFCNLKIWKFWTVLSCDFWGGGLVSYLVDLKWFLYLISCSASWDILTWVLSCYIEIVLNLKFNKNITSVCPHVLDTLRLLT